MRTDKQCVEEVREPGLWPHYHQCTRRTIPGSEFCKVHSPEAVAERRRKSDERFRAQMRNDMAPYRLARLIKELEDLLEGTQLMKTDVRAAVERAKE